MPSSEVSGLIKWLRREPWDAAFGELLERHLGRACDKAGVPLEELGEVIGEHWAMILWGCAFEDFLTREVAGAGNIVDDYLKRRGWNEKAPNKAYMTALRSSVISLYEVSDIRPGESFLARDLIRGGEPVRVSERTATHTLKPWDRLAARLVEVRGKTTLTGAVLPFEHELSGSLIAALGRVLARAPEQLADLVADLDIELSPEKAASVVDSTVWSMPNSMCTTASSSTSRSRCWAASARARLPGQLRGVRRSRRGSSFSRTVQRSRILATRWPSMTSPGCGKSSGLPICANDP